MGITDSGLRPDLFVDLNQGVNSVHHLVPRSHLQRFVTKSPYLKVFDKETRKCYAGQASKVFGEKNFYSFVNEEGEVEGTLEDFFSQVEAPAARLFDRLVHPWQMTTWILDFEDRQLIALFVALHILRSRRTRANLDKVATGLFGGDRKFAEKLDPRFLEYIESLSPALKVSPVLPNLHMRIILERLPDLAESLLRKSISIYSFEKRELMLGDHAVLLRPLPDAQFQTGLANKADFFIPLDSQHLLVLEAGRVREREGYASARLESRIVNQLTMLYATRHVLVPGDLDCQYASDILESNA